MEYINTYTGEDLSLLLRKRTRADSLPNGKKPLVALGIDGCRYGWCVVKLDSLGNSSMRLIEKIDELQYNEADIAVVDIPIGLSKPLEKRGFDEDARKALKNSKRVYSIFTTPCLEVVRKVMQNAEISDRKAWYKKACDISEDSDGMKISQQAFGIIPKIHEVDEFLRKNPDFQNVLVESHPELCFCDLLKHPCEHHKKKDIQGEIERVIALRKHMAICALLDNNPYKSKQVSRDDIIDAAVLAWYGLKQISL